jgi:hypothetical protein
MKASRQGWEVETLAYPVAFRLIPLAGNMGKRRWTQLLSGTVFSG